MQTPASSFLEAISKIFQPNPPSPNQIYKKRGPSIHYRIILSLFKQDCRRVLLSYKHRDYLLEKITNHPHSYKVDCKRLAVILHNSLHTRTEDCSGPFFTTLAIHRGVTTVNPLVLFTMTPYRNLFPDLPWSCHHQLAPLEMPPLQNPLEHHFLQQAKRSSDPLMVTLNGKTPHPGPKKKSHTHSVGCFYKL